MFFLPKGADHSDAGEIFPCDAKHLVQPSLNLFEHGDTDEHDTKNDHGKYGNYHHENERRLYIHGKGHDHGPENNKGRAQKQAQHQINAGLYLVDVAGHSCDQRGGSFFIHLGEGKTLDMGKKPVS